MTIFIFIISCIYFYLPAACANIGANLGRFIPVFKDIQTPIDFGKTMNGVRIVGEHKLYGSFLFGIVFGILIGLIKFFFLDQYMKPFLLFNFNFTDTLGLYSLMSVFALLGDIIKSILKRLFKIAPHSAWIPFDEIDHSTVSLFTAAVFFPISLNVILTTIGVYFFLHMAANVIGFWLKIKKVPY